MIRESDTLKMITMGSDYLPVFVGNQRKKIVKKVVRGFLKLLMLPNDYSKSSGVLEISL